MYRFLFDLVVLYIENWGSLSRYIGERKLASASNYAELEILSI